MVTLKIDEFTFPTEWIKSMKIDYNKIDGEGTKRNLNGNMRRQVVANKIKLGITCVPLLTEDNIKTILGQITKDTARVSFYNPKLGKVQTIRAYFNTPSVSPAFTYNGKTKYNGFDFNIIEL